jgi:hypothetical protein
MTCANTCNTSADCSTCTSYVGQTACCHTGTGQCYYQQSSLGNCPDTPATPDSGTTGS